ncbi:MAG: chromate transporter [Clostridiales bacterium]|nr:chromate transporter [Clostridiales bacterium]
MLEYLYLFWAFLKIGLLGFGGGYAMLSMIMTESEAFAVTAAQFAELNAIDMIVPGPIAINAATYVGYLGSGFPGAAAATLGVMIPSFALIPLVMRFLEKYKENSLTAGFMSGVRPAAVGLIAAAAAVIAGGVLLNDGAGFSDIFTKPLESVSFLSVGVFALTAVLNIRFKVNPILLTLAAGTVGAAASLIFYTV